MNGPQNWVEADMILDGDRCSYGCPHAGCVHEMAMLVAGLVRSTQALTAAVIATGAHKLQPAGRHEWLKATDPDYAAEQAAEAAL
jgi:hypothetical protein